MLLAKSVWSGIIQWVLAKPESSYRSYLSKQIILLVCVVGFAFSLISSIFLTFKEIEESKRRALDSFASFEKAIELPLEYALWQLDEGVVYRLIESITKAPHVARVTLEAPGVSTLTLSTKLEPNWVVRSFQIVHTHDGKTEDLGKFNVTLSKQSFNEELTSSILNKLLNLIAEYLLLCFGLFWIFHRKITIPILEIENEMEEFCQKNLIEADVQNSLHTKPKPKSEINIKKLFMQRKVQWNFKSSKKCKNYSACTSLIFLDSLQPRSFMISKMF